MAASEGEPASGERRADAAPGGTPSADAAPGGAPEPQAGSRTGTLRIPPRPLAGIVFVGMSTAVWWPAFQLGAWGVIFFDSLLAIWAAATAALLIVLLQRRPSPHRVRRALALAVPSVWLVLAFLIEEDDIPLVVALLDFVGIVVAALAIPFTIWVLVRILWPDFGTGLSRARLSLGFVIVAIVAVVSFTLGLNQARFLTCEDFTISGNSEPPGCTPADQP